MILPILFIIRKTTVPEREADIVSDVPLSLYTASDPVIFWLADQFWMFRHPWKGCTFVLFCKNGSTLFSRFCSCNFGFCMFQNHERIVKVTKNVTFLSTSLYLRNIKWNIESSNDRTFQVKYVINNTRWQTFQALWLVGGFVKYLIYFNIPSKAC